MNDNFDVLYNEVNGNISAANLATDSVTTAKIADSNVTTAKIADAAVTTAKINDGAVTSPKLSLTGAQFATVVTSESTSSSSYTDLATTTDTVTVTVGSSGIVLITLSHWAGTTTEEHMSFAASGANTIGASDDRCTGTTAANQVSSFASLLTGLNPGSTTFKAKYRTSGTSGAFVRRRISVVPL